MCDWHELTLRRRPRFTGWRLTIKLTAPSRWGSSAGLAEESAVGCPRRNSIRSWHSSACSDSRRNCRFECSRQPRCTTRSPTGHWRRIPMRIHRRSHRIHTRLRILLHNPRNILRRNRDDGGRRHRSSLRSRSELLPLLTPEAIVSSFVSRQKGSDANHHTASRLWTYVGACGIAASVPTGRFSEHRLNLGRLRYVGK
jgi:hypothetical protein